MSEGRQGSISLLDFVALGPLQEMQRAISNATAVSMVVLDAVGQPVTERSGRAPLCQELDAPTEGGDSPCQQERASILRDADQCDRLIIRACGAGLLHFAVPIRAYGAVVCYLYGGGC